MAKAADLVTATIATLQENFEVKVHGIICSSTHVEDAAAGCCNFTRNLCDTSEALMLKTAAKKAGKWYCFRISWLTYGDTSEQFWISLFFYS